MKTLVNTLEGNKDEKKSRKRKSEVSDEGDDKQKKSKNSEVKTSEDKKDRDEKTAKKIKKKEKGEKGEKEKEKAVLLYNDKNVSINYFDEAPENIVQLKCKMSSNLMLTCKTVETVGDSKSGSYDYAALGIIRRQRNGAAFEFNMPLQITPILVKACQYIMRENEKFFSRFKHD